MSGGVTKEMMDGLPVFARSIISDQDKEISSLKEKVEELETVMGAWHNIFGTMQLSRAKDRLDFSEEKVKQLEAQIAVLRTVLENIKFSTTRTISESILPTRYCEIMDKVNKYCEQTLSSPSDALHARVFLTSFSSGDSK